MLKMDLTREQFERMIESYIKRSIEIVKKAMENASLTPENIDHVIMVGGSSTIPMVRRALVDVFGEKKVMMNIDAMKCVAMGAGILAFRLGEQQTCPEGHTNPPLSKKCVECGLSLEFVGDVTPKKYGIELVDGNFSVIIPKGTAYPCLEPFIKTFSVAADNLRRLKIVISAGSEKIAADNEYQTTVWVPLPPDTPKGTPIDVYFNLNDNGILEKGKVRLKDGSGREVEFFIAREGEKRSQVEKKMENYRSEWDKKKNHASDEQKRKFDDLYDQATNALNKDENKTAENKLEEIKKLIDGIQSPEPVKWIQQAKGLINFSNSALTKYGHFMEAEYTFQLKSKVTELEKAVNNNDQMTGEIKLNELNKLLDKMPAAVQLILAGNIYANLADNAGISDLANEARTLVSEIEDALRKRDNISVHEKADKLNIVIKKIIEMLDQPPPLPPGDGGVKDGGC